MQNKMQSAKYFTLRRLPTLSRWILTKAEADNAAAHNGLQAFAVGINKRLADGDGRSDNLVHSPLSVYAALSLVAAGARERTLSELLGVIGAPSRQALTDHVRALAGQALADRSDAGGPRISFACGLWHDRTLPLRAAYRDAAAQSYKAVIRTVNFHQKPEEARNQINAWAAASTNNLIPSIVGPGMVSPLTALVLANAIYFKGRWETPFDKERTKKKKFHRLDGSNINVPFMHGGFRTWQRVACHDGFKVLQLRYEQGQPLLPHQPAPVYSMCVFLPKARDGLWPLVDMISCNPDFLHQHLPRRPVLVGHFRLPKFKLSFNTNMTSVLGELGLKEAFDLRKADLSDMAEGDDAVGRRRLALEQLIHKAVIEVNEEGTEAAAVTATSMLKTRSRNSPPPPPLVNFVADHPFAFFVIEEVSGAIMFAGQVVDPSIE